MADSDSDSALSDPLDLPNAPPSSFGGRSRQNRTGEDDPMSGTMSPQDDDAMGSDDEDYDSVTPPMATNGYHSAAPSSSRDSPRPRKRKSGPETDEHMLNDPELYGLRRSVSAPSPTMSLSPINVSVVGSTSSIPECCKPTT